MEDTANDSDEFGDAEELETLILDELLISGQGQDKATPNAGNITNGGVDSPRRSLLPLASTALIMMRQRLSKPKERSLLKGLQDERELAQIADLRSHSRSLKTTNAVVVKLDEGSIGQLSEQNDLSPRFARVDSKAFAEVEQVKEEEKTQERDKKVDKKRATKEEEKKRRRENGKAGLRNRGPSPMPNSNKNVSSGPILAAFLESILDHNAIFVRPTELVLQLWDKHARGDVSGHGSIDGSVSNKSELLEKDIRDVVVEEQIWWPSVVRGFVKKNNMTLRGFADKSDASSPFGLRLFKLVPLKQQQDGADGDTANLVDVSSKYPMAEQPSSSNASPNFAESLSEARIVDKLKSRRVRAGLDAWWSVLCPEPTYTQACTADQLSDATAIPPRLLDLLSRKLPLKKRVSAIHGCVFHAPDAESTVQSEIWTTPKLATSSNLPASSLEKQSSKPCLGKETSEMAREARQFAMERERRKSVRKAMLNGNFQFDAETLCEVGNPFDREEGRKLRAIAVAKANKVEAYFEAARKRQSAQLDTDVKHKGHTNRKKHSKTETTMPLETFLQAEELIYQVLVSPACQGVASNPVARRLALRDFQRVTNGHHIIRSSWEVLMLELVDVWTNTTEDEEYVVFLHELLIHITASTALMSVAAARQIHRARQVAQIEPRILQEERKKQKQLEELQRENDEYRQQRERWPSQPVYLRPRAWTMEGKPQGSAGQSEQGPGPMYYPNDFYVTKSRQDLILGAVQTSVSVRQGFVISKRIAGQQRHALRRKPQQHKQQHMALKSITTKQCNNNSNNTSPQQANDPLVRYLATTSRRISQRAEGLVMLFSNK